MLSVKSQTKALQRSIVCWALLGFLWHHSYCHGQFLFSSLKSTENKALKGFVCRVINVNNYFQCYIACEDSSVCFSVNFYPANGVCEINYASHLTHPQDLIDADGASYFLKQVDILGKYSKLPYVNISTCQQCQQGIIFFGCQTIQVENCKTHAMVNNDELLLDASGTSMAGLCQAVINPSSAPSEKYRIDVDIYTYRADGSNVMHPGIAFNVQDKSNMDIVYIRPHKKCSDSTHTIQAGSLIANSFKYLSSSCRVSSPPPGYAWFHAAVEVTASSVKLFLDNVLASTFTPHHPLTKRGGVLVFNSRGNLVRFRSYRITRL